MRGVGHIADHAILANAVGQGCGYGCHVGRIASFDYHLRKHDDAEGKLRFYLGEGAFIDDTIPADFFGCGGVAEIPGLQDVLLHVGNNGYRHHVSVTPGRVLEPMREALERYLGFDVSVPQKTR